MTNKLSVSRKITDRLTSRHKELESVNQTLNQYIDVLESGGSDVDQILDDLIAVSQTAEALKGKLVTMTGKMREDSASIDHLEDAVIADATLTKNIEVYIKNDPQAMASLMNGVRRNTMDRIVNQLTNSQAQAWLDAISDKS